MTEIVFRKMNERGDTAAAMNRDELTRRVGELLSTGNYAMAVRTDDNTALMAGDDPERVNQSIHRALEDEPTRLEVIGIPRITGG